jgi:hypothetical protein
LPKHFCGRVHCPDERWFLFFCKLGLFSRFFFVLFG